MHIAILTFEGFNELDSLVALGILNRVKKTSWRSRSLSRSRSLDERRAIEAQATLERAIGYGIYADRSALLARLRLDPSRQLVGAQCSGTLILAKLGVLAGVPACTDLITKPWVQEAGVEVLNQPFFARGNVATAGGCLSSQYLAAWIIARTEGVAAAENALHYVAPVGEKDVYVKRAMDNIRGYLGTAAPAIA